MFGLFLVILGVLFLFQEMGIITGDFWGHFWPILLIVFGLSIMKKDKGSNDCWAFWESKKKKNHHKVVDEQ